MYKLVAADDEVTALKFIDYCIKRNELPVALVGTAMDGKEAIGLIDDLHPDIVLLDIKMPKLNGVEVGKYIAEKHPGTKVIMLTAYDQFDFAQQAIRFNAYDYLLKPVKPEQLIEVIKKAIKEINRQRLVEEQNQNLTEIKNIINSYNEPLMKILSKPELKNVEQVVSWIQNYLQVNYHKNITLEHLAEKVYLSPCYVSRAFRQVTGLNFMQYLTEIRIERAMQLLKIGKYSVSEVAEAVGYKDASYFSQMFKKKTGFVPSELINKQAK
ncbi:Helix-turn-helix domain-containing protein [Desulfotomaculum arcticum]|uniref:Stage 0 sporulation protein A homolog n=1 Tax=Desulfotruncus arcticus DSM 17038 TaxID=1121424 RepID=A0A1I2P4D1_9FIRM|nr:response regulator [Desulfotruncus arcticus]SFG09939.1 Helix-turn-helix domain-containing protein [Desulfotomaculum arcticum] [Desulfotruncus arcticus DSM 17038]